MNRFLPPTKIMRPSKPSSILYYRYGIHFVVLALMATLAACAPNSRVEGVNPGTPIAEEESTDNLIGQTVSLRSDVRKQVSDYAFTMTDDGYWNGDGGEILIINASGRSKPLPDNTKLQVVGELRRLNLSEIENEYGAQLDSQMYAEYEDQPIIVANSIALAPEPEEVVNDPDSFYGEIVAVTGAVGEIVSPQAFTLGNHQFATNGELLVVNPTATQGLGNQEVIVVGEIRPFALEEIQSDYNLNWDSQTQQRMQTEYTNSLMLVATGVYASPE